MAAVGMFIANAFINVFIGSGSGQTVVAMPIMAPLADVVGVTRQMAVLTLQYGDGFTNLFLPTNVNLMACLAMAGVDFKRWIKFFSSLLCDSVCNYGHFHFYWNSHWILKEEE